MGNQNLGVNRNRGFTLMEVLVVIAILGILAAASIPAFSVWLPNYRLKRASSDLYSNMQLARMVAIKQNQNCSINFSTGPDQYTISTVSLSFSKTVALSEYGSGIQFNGPTGQTFATSTLTFNSRGTSNSGYVYLSNQGNGAYYRVGPLSSGVVKMQKYDGSNWN